MFLRISITNEDDLMNFASLKQGQSQTVRIIDQFNDKETSSLFGLATSLSKDVLMVLQDLASEPHYDLHYKCKEMTSLFDRAAVLT